MASARSRSVMTPTARPPSQTTTEPTLRSRISWPTRSSVSDASAVTTDCVMTSLMRMAATVSSSRWPPPPRPVPPERVRARVALLLLLVVALAFPAASSASQSQETVVQDDPKLVFYKTSEALDHTLGMLEDLGVDRIRVSVI